MDTVKMRACSHLLPDPGGEVVRDLLAEIDRLTAEAVSLRHLAADAVLMARHGEYSNGVTDPTGMIDEGSVKAGEVITDLDRRAVALNVTVGSILYDHTRFYGQAAQAAEAPGRCCIECHWLTESSDGSLWCVKTNEVKEPYATCPQFCGVGGRAIKAAEAAGGGE